MLICRVESYDIFGNRAAALVPGHCRTRVPFFFPSFIIMIRPINLGLAVIPPLLPCKPGSCHPQGLPLQSPGPAWAQAQAWATDQRTRIQEPLVSSRAWKLLEEGGLGGNLMGLGSWLPLLCASCPGHLEHVHHAFPKPALSPGLAPLLSSRGHCGIPAIVWGWPALQDDPLQEGRACSFSCTPSTSDTGCIWMDVSVSTPDVSGVGELKQYTSAPG